MSFAVLTSKAVICKEISNIIIKESMEKNVKTGYSKYMKKKCIAL